MRRSHLAVAVVVLSAAGAAAFPFPSPLPPPPDGAIRRYGRPDPPAPPPKSDLEMLGGRRVVIRSGDDLTGASFAQTPDGKHLVVGDKSGRLDVFDFATGRLSRRLQEAGAGVIRVVAVSPDGQWLACGRGRGDVQLWDLAAGKAVRTLDVGAGSNENGRGDVQRVVFGPDSKVLFTSVDAYSGGPNSGNSAWDVATGKRLWNTPAVGYNLAADPKGRWVLTGLLQEEPARLGLLDAATGKVVRSLVIEPGLQTDETGLVFGDASAATLDRMFTPDGSRLVTIHGDNTVRVWDPEAGKEVTRMKLDPRRTAEPGGLAGSPDGRWVAVRGDREVQVWEVASGRWAYTVRGLEGSPRELAFTRDGRGLLTSSGPSPVLWPLRPTTLPALDRPADELWTALGGDDSAGAYRLVWAFAENPKAAVPLFRDRVRPAELVMARDRFDRLVTALDAPRYAARERAEADLMRAGLAVPVPWLRTAMTTTRSEEVQARLRRVLGARETPGPARWRLARAVQALEMAGTAEARALLKEWSTGPVGGFLTEEATAAVSRLSAGR